MINKRTPSRIVFEVFNTLFMIGIAFIMLYPLLYVVFASLSDSNALIRHGGELLFKPLGFNLEAYKTTFRDPLILSGYANTIFIVVVGTVLNLVFSSMLAYVLTQTQLKLHKAITFFCMFTMYFSGGLVPFYLLVENLGLLNSIWSLILPSLISVYNVIILRTGFMSVPKSLTESAMIDGATPMTILVKIILPLSKASLAVIGLYYAVSHWNSWFNAAIFIRSDATKWPLQLVLRQILIMNDVNTSGVQMDQANNVAESIKYASIVVATLPILAIYPFIQKYFVRGVMIGAVKG